MDLNTEELGRVAEIEEAARDAWPAEEVAICDGWWLRASRGVTGRGNSVWSVRTGTALALGERVDAVESFYAGRGLASRFQMTPAAPADLDEELVRRGYRADSHTWVQTAYLSTILVRTPPLQALPHLTLEVAEAFDEEWFALYCDAEQATGLHAEVRASILKRIAGPVAFAMASVQGAPAAVGLGVVGGEWLGIFCMSTVPRARRQGAATAILRTLAIWGGLYDARGAYLQVKQENAGAVSTYARAGFVNAFPYFYRIRDGQGQ
jgi:GNAT superfamily N-acetyltransferase